MRDPLTRRAAAVALAGMAGAAGTAAAEPLARYAWKRRVLLVFVPAEGAALEAQRQRVAAARSGFLERDMTVLAVIGEGRVEPLLGTGTEGGAAAALRARFGVPAGQPFAAVLVGKDMTEKWRADQPAEPAALFGIIDGMPMRRGEMRHDG